MEEEAWLMCLFFERYCSFLGKVLWFLITPAILSFAFLVLYVYYLYFGSCPWFEFSSFKSSLGSFGFLSPSPSSVCFTGGCYFIVMIFCLGLSVTFLFTHVLFLPNFVLPKWQKLQISFSGKCFSFGSSPSRCWNLPLKIPCCEDHCEVWLTRHWQNPFLAEHPSECFCILNIVQYFFNLRMSRDFFSLGTGCLWLPTGLKHLINFSTGL